MKGDERRLGAWERRWGRQEERGRELWCFLEKEEQEAGAILPRFSLRGSTEASRGLVCGRWCVVKQVNRWCNYSVLSITYGQLLWHWRIKGQLSPCIASKTSSNSIFPNLCWVFPAKIRSKDRWVLSPNKKQLLTINLERLWGHFPNIWGKLFNQERKNM